MSKILQITNGNYKVQSQGDIFLDPGAVLGSQDSENVNQGTVYILGSLQVTGDTVTVNNENLDILDNIILVNKGETGAGISLANNGQAGIQVDRGTESDAQILFDESVEWSNPQTGQTAQGAFILKDETDSLIGLRTSSITTGGGDLYLINNGSGVVSVTGTTDYEKQIFNYDLQNNIDITVGTNGIVDDDHIPNTRAVVDFVEEYFTVNNRNLISQDDTKVEIKDELVSGDPSNIDFSVDGVSVANLSSSQFEIYNLTISENNVSTTAINNNLNLITSGEGTVKISNVMEFDKRSAEPVSVSGSIKVYGSDVGPGDSGVYYMNDNNRSDELISRNRALLYSMVI